MGPSVSVLVTESRDAACQNADPVALFRPRPVRTVAASGLLIGSLPARPLLVTQSQGPMALLANSLSRALFARTCHVGAWSHEGSRCPAPSRDIQVLTRRTGFGAAPSRGFERKSDTYAASARRGPRLHVGWTVVRPSIPRQPTHHGPRRLKWVRPSRTSAIRFRLLALVITQWSQPDQIGAHDGLPTLTLDQRRLAARADQTRAHQSASLQPRQLDSPLTGLQWVSSRHQDSSPRESLLPGLRASGSGSSRLTQCRRGRVGPRDVPDKSNLAASSTLQRGETTHVFRCPSAPSGRPTGLRWCRLSEVPDREVVSR